MGLKIELELDKSNNMDQSPNTVLPPLRRCSDMEERYMKAKAKPSGKDDMLRVKQGFTEISFHRYRSSSCKSSRSRPFGLENSIELKRGSVYQTSKEVRKMKRMGTVEGKRKLELSRSSDTSFSFTFVDSVCISDKESQQKRSSLMPLNPILEPLEPCSSDGFIEICLISECTEKQLVNATREDSSEDLNHRGDQAAAPLSENYDLVERETVLTLHKSHSAKVELPYSPSPSESDRSSRVSSRGRFRPIRKMFDPFVKSKSLRSPSGYSIESDEVKTIGKGNMRRDRTSRKSLLDDFSHNTQSSELDSQFLKKDHNSAVACSPVHLHGHLKLENKHGMPFFVFYLDCPEDVYIAKTWKAGNASNWVYTFHSIGSRKKSNASVWGWNDSSKESSMVGQMLVSCYMCSELRDGGVFNDSMVKEFVLYDMAHARQSVSSQECSTCSPDLVKPPKGYSPGVVVENYDSDNRSDAVKHKHQPKCASDNGDSDASNESSPWAAADLHPDLEIAAIVIQDQIEKRESLKYKKGDKIDWKNNLLNLSIAEQSKKDLHNSTGPGKLKVVIPFGNHGLPSAESRGPSSLLERWRSGGGCDCGGWDMACPLVVFGNPSIHCAEDQPLVDNCHPLELFFQGAKDNTPALTVTFVEEGQYTVDFHAKLSTLQAFSICVAILHSTEASAASGQESTKQLLQFNSLKVLIEEESKLLIEAVTEEEKKKVTNMVKEIPSSYLPYPPFSPIARV